MIIPEQLCFCFGFSDPKLYNFSPLTAHIRLFLGAAAEERSKHPVCTVGCKAAISLRGNDQTQTKQSVIIMLITKSAHVCYPLQTHAGGAVDKP